MIHNRQTIVSPFYFKIVYMKFLFEMLLKTFPPSPGVIYLFVAHLTSPLESIFRMVCLTGFLSTKRSSHSHFQQFLMPLSISKFLLESISTTLEGMLHSFFYKLVSSSDFVYRSDNYFREPVNRTIDRPIRSRLVYYSLKRPGKERKQF